MWQKYIAEARAELEVGRTTEGGTNAVGIEVAVSDTAASQIDVEQSRAGTRIRAGSEIGARAYEGIPHTVNGVTSERQPQ